MNRRLLVVILVACAVGALSADGGSDERAPCRYRWEEVNVVSLASAEHRRIVPDTRTSRSLTTRGAIGVIAHEDYVLQVVAETRPRDGSLAAEVPNTTVDESHLRWCDSVVRQYSNENLVDLDIVSSAGIGDAYPAGASLVDVFDVSVELYLRDGSAPSRIFNPRSAQTISHYLARRPRLPMVVNLRLNRSPGIQSAHRFSVLMHLADGNTHSVKSPTVMIDP